MKAMNAHAGALVLHERAIHEAATSDLSVIEAQLIEAACRVRHGDREAARVYIAHAMALLYRKPTFGTSVTRGLSKICDVAAEGYVDDDYEPTYRSLSHREAGVLQMIARGMSNKCIARSLGIAPETVKTHAKSILSKLESRTRAQAVARAEAIGFL